MAGLALALVLSLAACAGGGSSAYRASSTRVGNSGDATRILVVETVADGDTDLEKRLVTKLETCRVVADAITTPAREQRSAAEDLALEQVVADRIVAFQPDALLSVAQSREIRRQRQNMEPSREAGYDLALVNLKTRKVAWRATIEVTAQASHANQALADLIVSRLEADGVLANCPRRRMAS